MIPEVRRAGNKYIFITHEFVDLRPKRVLDVGTGYGMNFAFLARRFGRFSRIWSVDASSGVVREMREVMRKYQYSRHIIVKQANAERLPFNSDQFELVVSLFALHHLSNPPRNRRSSGGNHGGSNPAEYTFL